MNDAPENFFPGNDHVCPSRHLHCLFLPHNEFKVYFFCHRLKVNETHCDMAMTNDAPASEIMGSDANIALLPNYDFSDEPSPPRLFNDDGTVFAADVASPSGTFYSSYDPACSLLLQNMEVNRSLGRDVEHAVFEEELCREVNLELSAAIFDDWPGENDGDEEPIVPPCEKRHKQVLPGTFIHFFKRHSTTLSFWKYSLAVISRRRAY